MPTPVEDFAAAQAAEYGTYVALAPIRHDGVLAYGVGDAVPVSNVEAYGYLEAGLVAPVGEVPEPVTPTAPVPPTGDPVVIDNTQEG